MRFDPNVSMFHFDPDFPVSLKEVLNPPVRFRAATLTAMKQFKKSKPWRGTEDERIAKFTMLVNDLSEVYGIQAPLPDTDAVDPNEPSDRSYYMPMLHSIYLKGRLSVITLLHEFAHALGRNQADTQLRLQGDAEADERVGIHRVLGAPHGIADWSSLKAREAKMEISLTGVAKLVADAIWSRLARLPS